MTRRLVRLSLSLVGEPRRALFALRFDAFIAVFWLFVWDWALLVEKMLLLYYLYLLCLFLDLPALPVLGNFIAIQIVYQYF